MLPKITDDECLMHLEKNIQRIRQNNNSQVWLGGDFNLGGIEWTLLISELLLVKNKSRMDFDFSVK
jgi:hypothetical protein